LRFSLVRSRMRVETFPGTSLDLRLPSRVRSSASCRMGFIPSSCLPCGSSPLRRVPDRGQPLVRRVANSAGSGASSAFRTLSRLSSDHDLPALFHAGPAHGVHPSGFRTGCRAWSPLRCSCPLGVASRMNPLPPEPLARTRWNGISPTFLMKEGSNPSENSPSGLCSLQPAVPSAGGSCRRKAATLLGFWVLPGGFSPPGREASRASSSPGVFRLDG